MSVTDRSDVIGLGQFEQLGNRTGLANNVARLELIGPARLAPVVRSGGATALIEATTAG